MSDKDHQRADPPRTPRIAPERLAAWPHQVIVIDVEPAHARFARPEESGIRFVGTREYELKGRSYKRGAHRIYGIGDADGLHELLAGRKALIIGHNILKFDFRILRPHMSLEGIIERSVDILAFLFEKANGPMSGLKLQSLAKHNLGKSKTLDPRRLGDLWERGKQREVIGYNRNDCDLTFELWYKMLTGESIKLIQNYSGFSAGPIITMTDEDLPVLLGQAPLLTFKQWIGAIKADPNRDMLWDIVRGTIGRRPLRTVTDYNAIYCVRCKAYHIFRVRRGLRQPRGRKWKLSAPRPVCGECVGELRAVQKPVCIGVVQSQAHRYRGKPADVCFSRGASLRSENDPLGQYVTAYASLGSQRIDPQFLVINVDWTRMSMILQRQGERENALKAIKIACRIDPKNESTLKLRDALASDKSKSPRFRP